MRAIKPWVLGGAIILWSLAGMAKGTCNLAPGLFERRVLLAAQLTPKNGSEVKNLTDSEDTTQSEIKAIDQQYYSFMLTVSDSVSQGDLSQLDKCCKQNVRDPIATLICEFASYRAKRTSADEFVQTFPASARKEQAFWMLDGIANVERTPNSLPPLFRVEGPVTLFITELFKLVEAGNTQALERYLELYRSADGMYAELMEDQAEHLFSEHPEVVLRNWSVVKGNQDLLDDLQESLSDDQKRLIFSRARAYCSTAKVECKELESSLK